MFKDEYKLLEGKTDVGKAYVEEVLPEKMKYNLNCLKNFSFWSELCTMFRTVLAVLGVSIKDKFEL
jgi:lipopolysaccharide/colanic/teichoic acid biosynthesis glycosyltransferase